MIVLFKDSAFRHGFGKSHYHEIMRNPRLVLRSRRGYDNVYEILGRTDAGDYVHVVSRRYRKGVEKIVVVFHLGLMSESDRRRFRGMMEL